MALSWTKNITKCLLALLLIVSPTIFAQSSFVVRKIRFEGLQRISLATALNYVPLRVGQSFNIDDSHKIIAALYNTGFFSNVSLARQGGDLIIIVQERPTIGLIRFSGNKVINKKALLSVLKQAGIQEGLTYDPMSLSSIKQAMLQQYYSLGRYNATVTTSVEPEERNRVAINIKVYEGEVTKVQQIKIIGNEKFSESELLKQFKLTTPHFWSFITGGDKFSQDKLSKDLASLHDFYLDRGYLRFNIKSTQVAITPDRQSAYVTIDIQEGPVYTLSGYTLVGDLLNQRDNLQKLIQLKSGDTFSRKKVVATVDALKKALADQGYALAAVDVIPTIDDANHQVYLTFDVKPGQRIYVNQITFSGNTKTADYVLRRELRQPEGGVYSAAKVEESKRRIANLGYLTNIQVNMEPVPQKQNQVNLDYHVTETSTATLSAQAGYSEAYGFMYGANLVQNNFMGTGKTVSVGFNRSSYLKSYSFNYFNPYYTQSGISRGFTVYSQKVTPGDVGLTDYTSKVYGLSVDYRFPMSEYDFLTASLGYEHLRISASGTGIAQQILNYLADHGNRYNEGRLTLGWLHNTYDRAIFPTEGFNQWIGSTLGLPIFGKTSVEYYKLGYDAKWYRPLDQNRNFILRLSTDLGYGNGYGNLQGQLPFFRNYFAGGIGSVSGYDANSLGPKDEYGNALGGNIMTVGEAALIFPNHISQSLRTALIFDVGNVYENRFKPSTLRTASGLEVDWLSPLGPLSFSLAAPLNARAGDDKSIFQFTMSTSF